MCNGRKVRGHFLKWKQKTLTSHTILVCVAKWHDASPVWDSTKYEGLLISEGTCPESQVVECSISVSLWLFCADSEHSK